jgi:CheY-like chemotaxis protein
MKNAVKAGSMSSVYRAIAALEKQGFIARRHGRLREISVLRLPTPGVPDEVRGVTPTRQARLSRPVATRRPGLPPDRLTGVVRSPETNWPGFADRFTRAPHESVPALTAGLSDPDGQSHQARTVPNVDVFTRARELVGDIVWRKLSPGTQASILRSELHAMEAERAGGLEVPPEAAAPLTTGPFSVAMRIAGDISAVEPPWSGYAAMSYRTAGSAPAFGVDRSEILPSLEALHIATDALRLGHGLAEPSRDPEVVAQAIELSFLLVAYGLVPAEPRTATQASAETRAPGATGQIDHSQPNRNILVVDDASDVLVSVTAFLVSAGFTVTTAADGDAALRLIAGDPRISILVTDFVMPGLSGVDLIAQAAQIRPNLKALLITGYPNADGLADLPPLTSVLTKPFRRATLIERVNGLADGIMPPANEREFVYVSK